MSITIEVRRIKVIQPEPVRMPKVSEDNFFQVFSTNRPEAIRKLLKQALGDEEYAGIEEGYATNWGPMVVKRMRLTKTERHHSYRHHYSFVGPFRYPHRAVLPISDGRAWHHRASGKGGTVLIDWSGSMSLCVEEVLGVLEKNPLATVAAYHSIKANKEGQLTILAANNRYVAPLDLVIHHSHKEGGNVVDGPALKWLAYQERPRYWVSDGQVTGIYDREANPAMLVEVARVISRAGIKWIRHLGDLPKGHL